ncbi:MAG: hypothetical protein J6A01_00595, partial [Proteobacteria bacterium]|nr:hypothetical protein [Pseudomonadota bacterium]
STIDKIKLNTVISYSQRNRNTSRQDEGALISSNQCKNTDGPFTTTLYINDIKVDYNYNATACINSIQGNTTGRLRRIWGENDCNNSKADGFTCTKVKVKDNKDPIFIPLFDTAMIKDNAIQW